MSASRKQRLEARLANLHVSSLRGTAKRQASHWPLYAAVTGSALAMSANAPVPVLNPALRNPVAVAVPHFLPPELPSNSHGVPLMRATDFIGSRIQLIDHPVTGSEINPAFQQSRRSENLGPGVNLRFDNAPVKVQNVEILIG